VLIAVILVFIVILYCAVGPLLDADRTGDPVLVPDGHPWLLAMMGYTINMIVLFSLILAVGMLVDDAIIVTEFAERRMSEGMHARAGVRAGGQAHGGSRSSRPP
jgi:multidrug efflux pump